MSEQVVKRYSLSEFAEQHTYPIGPGTYVNATDYDALHAEAEALRAENGRLQADRDRANQYANQQALECNKLSTDLEAARGLLREVELLEGQRDKLAGELAAIKGQEVDGGN